MSRKRFREWVYKRSDNQTFTVMAATAGAAKRELGKLGLRPLTGFLGVKVAYGVFDGHHYPRKSGSARRYAARPELPSFPFTGLT